MKKNMGRLDRTLRFVAGIAILFLGAIFQSWWGLIGLIPLVTAIVGVCPGYLPFGIHTCEKEDREVDGSCAA